MKTNLIAFAVFGLITSVLGSGSAGPTTVTVTQTADLVARRAPTTTPKPFYIPASKLGLLLPLPTESLTGSVGPYSNFLVQQDPKKFRWIGPDPSFVTIATVTHTKSKSPSSTSTATITQSVLAAKNKAGGLDILLSPAVITKLQKISKQVPPCSSKKRASRVARRGAACGFQGFLEAVGSDEGGTLEQLDLEVVLNEDPRYDPEYDSEHDSGYESLLEEEAEGPPQHPDGFVDDPQIPEVLETFVLGSEAEAVAIAQAAGASDVALFGTISITTASFLSLIYISATSKSGVQPVYNIPAESIHKITKTKTKPATSTKTPATTTTSSSCPTGDPYPNCASDCVPTSTQASNAKATDIVNWACSEGKSKNCECIPVVKNLANSYDQSLQQAIWTGLDDLAHTKTKPNITCPPPVSDVPSKWFGNITKTFCPRAMSENSLFGYGIAPYDIYGNILPFRKLEGVQPRSPPEKPDYYEGYKFFLHYKPGNGSCLLGRNSRNEQLCIDAYEELVKSNCGTNSGSEQDRLFVKASIDVGCATFSWNVASPAAPMPTSTSTPTPTLGAQHCYDRRTHPPVNPDTQDWAVKAGCALMIDTVFRSGDKPFTWTPKGTLYDTKDNSLFQVKWIDGCDMLKEQSVSHPLSDNKSVTCRSLMRQNFANCDNGGAGGVRQVGCLEYMFYGGGK